MYAKFIHRQEADRLIKKGALLVDMRSPVAFRDGTIDGAVNLPLRNFLNKITGLDKKTKLVLFSDKSDDEDITAGVTYGVQLGFDVFVSDFTALTGPTQ